jgi:hypothetical protein
MTRAAEILEKSITDIRNGHVKVNLCHIKMLLQVWKKLEA